MKKRFIRSIFATAAALLLAGVVGSQVYATDYDDINESSQPEYLYYIEGTGSYFLPGGNGNIFFNLGKWYRQSGESWFTSADLDGPWSGITRDALPRDLAELSPDFRDTRRLGMIPYKTVVGPEQRDDHKYGPRYYTGRYYDDYDRKGYRRRWNPHGKFWFFVAPDFIDDDWEDGHRRRRRRGRY